MAKQRPDLGFTSLNYFIDLDWLKEAYRLTRKDGATGIDGQTARAYAENLEENLQSLLDRAKSGRYRAPALRRAHIPKGTANETRAIGIPTFEDKILQRAVTMVLDPIYEQDFLSCSYGITGNSEALSNFYNETKRTWRKWLSRRSQRGYLSWDKFTKFLRHYPLPTPIVTQSIYRQQRTLF